MSGSTVSRQAVKNLSPRAHPMGGAARDAGRRRVRRPASTTSFDRVRLAAAIDRLFTSHAFDVGFPLADGVPIADVSGYEAWKDWVEALPETTSPAVLGLPGNAEEMLLRVQGRAHRE